MNGREKGSVQKFVVSSHISVSSSLPPHFRTCFVCIFFAKKKFSFARFSSALSSPSRHFLLPFQKKNKNSILFVCVFLFFRGFCFLGRLSRWGKNSAVAGSSLPLTSCFLKRSNRQQQRSRTTNPFFFFFPFFLFFSVFSLLASFLSSVVTAVP